MQKWVGAITLTSAHKPLRTLLTVATLLIRLDFRYGLRIDGVLEGFGNTESNIRSCQRVIY